MQTIFQTITCQKWGHKFAISTLQMSLFLLTLLKPKSCMPQLDNVKMVVIYKTLTAVYCSVGVEISGKIHDLNQAVSE